MSTNKVVSLKKKRKEKQRERKNLAYKTIDDDDEMKKLMSDLMSMIISASRVPKHYL